MPLEKIVEHPAFIGALVLFAALALQWIVGRTARRLARGQYLSKTSAERLRSGARLAILFIALFIGLQATGAMGHAWAVVSATVAALAVGFVAVWSVLSNVTTALILLGARPFRVGDQVEVYEGDKLIAQGEVLDLNLFFTTLSGTGAVSRVPNNFFLQRVTKVVRRGKAPNPAEDASEPFYSSTSNPKVEAP